MRLQTNSDAAYLLSSNTWRRATGYHYCGSHNEKINVPIHILAKIIKNVMALVNEAEIPSLYINAQLVMIFFQTIIDMGHLQPPAIIRTDNKTACRIVTGTMKHQQSKPIDMCFDWHKANIVSTNKNKLKLAGGTENLANYNSKHHKGS